MLSGLPSRSNCVRQSKQWRQSNEQDLERTIKLSVPGPMANKRSQMAINTECGCAGGDQLDENARLGYTVVFWTECMESASH
jgi:hypothetical protein